MARDDYSVLHDDSSSGTPAPIVVVNTIPMQVAPTQTSRSTFAQLTFTGARAAILSSIIPYLLICIGFRVEMLVLNIDWSDSALTMIIFSIWGIGATYIIAATLVAFEPASQLFKNLWLITVAVHSLLVLGVMAMWFYCLTVNSSGTFMFLFWLPAAVIAYIALSFGSVYRLKNATPNEYDAVPHELTYDDIKRQRIAAIICSSISVLAFLFGQMLVVVTIAGRFVAQSAVVTAITMIVLIAAVIIIIYFALRPHETKAQAALAILGMCMTATILSAAMEVFIPFLLTIIFCWVPFLMLLLAVVGYVPLATAIRFRDRVRQFGTLGEAQALPTVIPMNVIASPTYLQSM